ncbi:carbohydrate ABC transporter permease [Nonomuraea sp. NN258]|uniref:carbohydrate ABC transporter permease n=1 Tax=Nonomuraea antri TaxID=2730852 RepID=UPI00156A0C70|nr:carbohydrate ABC transporter permease [Nonomuraea antri]NRQ37505.1 carbohydrate ABC transporter permease [Nonomuraea antri]
MRAGQAAGLAGRYLLLLAVLAITVGPLLWQLTTALKSSGEDVYGDNASLLPQNVTLDNFVKIAEAVPIASYVTNSTLIAVLGIVSNLIFASFGGYMLSRPGWRGRKAVFLLLILAMMFPFESIMISLFLSIRDMGLVDTLAGAWLPGVVGAFNVLIMRAAFLAVPGEVEDAALMEGAGEWTRFWRVFLPSAKGAMTVITINSFIGAWDDFLWPLIVLRSEENFTLTLGLSRLSSSSFGVDDKLVMAGSMISVIPVVVLFFLAQRWFYRGVESGAVKM